MYESCSVIFLHPFFLVYESLPFDKSTWTITTDTTCSSFCLFFFPRQATVQVLLRAPWLFFVGWSFPYTTHKSQLGVGCELILIVGSKDLWGALGIVQWRMVAISRWRSW